MKFRQASPPSLECCHYYSRKAKTIQRSRPDNRRVSAFVSIKARCYRPDPHGFFPPICRPWHPAEPLNPLTFILFSHFKSSSLRCHKRLFRKKVLQPHCPCHTLNSQKPAERTNAYSGRQSLILAYEPPHRTRPEAVRQQAYGKCRMTHEPVFPAATRQARNLEAYASLNHKTGKQGVTKAPPNGIAEDTI